MVLTIINRNKKLQMIINKYEWYLYGIYLRLNEHVHVQGYDDPILGAHNCLSSQKYQISGRLLMYIRQDI